MLKSLGSLGIRSINFSQNKFNKLPNFYKSSLNSSSKFQTRNYLHWVDDIDDEVDKEDTLGFLGTLDNNLTCVQIYIFLFKIKTIWVD